MTIFPLKRLEHITDDDVLEIPDGSILTAYRGSIAHNMFVPSTDPNSIDDVDLIGIVIGQPEVYLGLQEWGSRGTKEKWQGRYDCVFYEIKKFFTLLLQGNPNVLGLLWTRREHFLEIRPAGKEILDNRHLFVGKHVWASFAGYARAQLIKMESQKFEGYMGEKRKALVDKFGYDTKNAAHCLRLLKMAKEFLETGEMRVFRENDYGYLLNVKKGAYPLSFIKGQAEEWFNEAQEAYNKSTLPEGPNRVEAEKLLVKLVRESFV